MIVNSRKTNADICTALGIDAAKVVSVTIKLSAGIPMVEVTYLLPVEKGDALSGTLKRYVLADPSAVEDAP